MNLYILNEKGNPVEEPDMLKWAKWFETANRRVAHEKIGNAEISTVFLGVNHSFGCGKPVLWETMVFGGIFDQSITGISIIFLPSNMTAFSCLHIAFFVKLPQQSSST